MPINHFYFIASEELVEGDLVMVTNDDEIRLCKKGEAPCYIVCRNLHGGEFIPGDTVECSPLYIGSRLILSMNIGGIFYHCGTHRQGIEKYETKQRIEEDIYYTGELKNAK